MTEVDFADEFGDTVRRLLDPVLEDVEHQLRRSEAEFGCRFEDLRRALRQQLDAAVDTVVARVEPELADLHNAIAAAGAQSKGELNAVATEVSGSIDRMRQLLEEHTEATLAAITDARDAATQHASQTEQVRRTLDEHGRQLLSLHSGVVLQAPHASTIARFDALGSQLQLMNTEHQSQVARLRRLVATTIALQVVIAVAIAVGWTLASSF